MRTRLCVLTLLLIALVVGGCASAAPSAVAPAVSSAGAGSGDGKAVPPVAPAAQAPGERGEESAAGDPSWDRYVIRNAELRLTVEDVEAASAKAKAITLEAGGYVAQSNVRRQDQRVVADIVIQVPAEAFDGTVSELRRLAITVDVDRTSTEDVTEEFVDNEARLRNLRATEESTLRLLDRASEMEDILAVQRELTTIRGQIEQIEGRQNYLKRRTEMSTINLHLTTDAGTALAADRSTWQPLTSARVAWESSLNFVSGALEAMLVAVVFLWWLIPVVAIVWFFWRRRRRARATLAPATSRMVASQAEEPRGPDDLKPQGAGGQP